MKYSFPFRPKIMNSQGPNITIIPTINSTFLLLPCCEIKINVDKELTLVTDSSGNTAKIYPYYTLSDTIYLKQEITSENFKSFYLKPNRIFFNDTQMQILQYWNPTPGKVVIAVKPI